MVFPFLQEKYPKYIHNIFVLFFLQKILQKWYFFFSQRQTFKKCHILHIHYTQVENHQFRVLFFLHYFLFLGNRFFSQTCCLFFSRVFVCRWMKTVIFKHVQTCLLPWLILRKMHYKISGPPLEARQPRLGPWLNFEK